MKFIYTYVICCLGISCYAQPVKNILIGWVKNYPSEKIYLIGAYSHELKDSSNVRDGNFVFSIPVNKTENPELSLSITKKYDDRTVLVFTNTVLSTDKKRYGGTAFILDSDTVKVSGDYNNLNHFLFLTAGHENVLSMRYQLEDFGNIQGLTSDEKLKKIKKIRNIIQNNPDSYFLLSRLYPNRGSYSKSDILSLVSTFNSSVKKTIIGEKFQVYLNNRPDPYQKFDISWKLKNDKGDIKPVFNIKTTNMLVFWASWCGPCRLEIPTIKKLDSLYKSKGLNIVSISIDENQTEWYKALQKEQMKWSQFIANKSDLDIIEARYNFSFIPVTIFIDQNGKELYRISGFINNQLSEYQKIIDKLPLSPD